MYSNIEVTGQLPKGWWKIIACREYYTGALNLLGKIIKKKIFLKLRNLSTNVERKKAIFIIERGLCQNVMCITGNSLRGCKIERKHTILQSQVDTIHYTDVFKIISSSQIGRGLGSRAGTILKQKSRCVRWFPSNYKNMFVFYFIKHKDTLTN